MTWQYWNCKGAHTGMLWTWKMRKKCSWRGGGWDYHKFVCYVCFAIRDASTSQHVFNEVSEAFSTAQTPF